MNAMRAFICGAMAAVAVGVTLPTAAGAQQFPPLDRRLLFDPSPLHEIPGAADRSAGISRTQMPAGQLAAGSNEQAWNVGAFILPGIDLDSSRDPGERNVGNGRLASGNEVRPSATATPALAPVPRRETFSLGVETERASTAFPRLSDDTVSPQEAPFGQRPRRRFVPFIGLSAKSPLY